MDDMFNYFTSIWLHFWWCTWSSSDAFPGVAHLNGATNSPVDCWDWFYFQRITHSDYTRILAVPYLSHLLRQWSTCHWYLASLGRTSGQTFFIRFPILGKINKAINFLGLDLDKQWQFAHLQVCLVPTPINGMNPHCHSETNCCSCHAYRAKRKPRHWVIQIILTWF